MHKVKTTHGEYEVYSLYYPQENEDAYSCENKCYKCSKTCEHGVSLYEITGDTVGA